MNTHREKLKAIADAIREKEGTTEPIVADDFPARIRAISGGGADMGELEAYMNGACIDFAATQGENTLHLRKQTGGHDCTVHWGDGEETTVPADGGNMVHTYAQAGTYRIYITGKSFAGFCVNGQEGAEKYVALHSMGRWETDTMTGAGVAFSGCTSLTSLPGDLFRYNKGITTFGGAFRGCTGLTSLPGDLFRYNTAAKIFSNVFGVCTGLTALPGDLFRYNAAATNFGGAFVGDRALTEIPGELFSGNPEAMLFGNVFGECTGLTAVPEDLFRCNIKVTSFSRCFSGCSELTTVPADLFRYNTEAVNFNACFQNCTKLQLREDIFGTDTETRFEGQSPNLSKCFERSSYEGEPGKAPELWKFTMTGSQKEMCFGGAGNSGASLSNYEEIPADWR